MVATTCRDRKIAFYTGTLDIERCELFVGRRRDVAEKCENDLFSQDRDSNGDKVRKCDVEMADREVDEVAASIVSHRLS